MTNKLLPLLLATGMTVFWSACKLDSDQIIPINDPPYFLVHYTQTVDALSAKTVTAGLDNVYLFTSYAIGSDDVTTCTGTFSQVHCLSDSCPGRLRFEFRNLQLGQVVLADSLFHLGEHPFKTTELPVGQTVYRTNFYVDSEAMNYTNFNWLFNGQSTAQGAATTFDFNAATDSARVALEASSNSGPTSWVQRIVSLTNTSAVFPQVDILIAPQANNYRLEAIGSGAPIASWNWHNGITLPVFEQDLLEPDYLLTGLSATSHSASARLQGLSPDPGQALHTVNFTHTTTLVTLPADMLQLSSVTLQWTDEWGQVWRSDRGVQEANAQFRVLESQFYQLNELGQSTWEMKVVFTGYLYNQNGERTLFTGEGRVAVAFP